MPVSVTVDGTAVHVPAHLPAEHPIRVVVPDGSAPSITPMGESVRVPLGQLVGARSGDKGGAANVGVWVPKGVPDRDAAYAWLVTALTPDRVRHLLPEASLLAIDVHPLPNLHAVNIVIHRLLGRGVAENSRVDPQAKGLGEHLRARLVDIPRDLLPDASVDLS